MSGHRSPLETDYVRALLACAPFEFPLVRLFRRNVGLVRMADERMFRAGTPGQCDLYALCRGGAHVEVECKRWGKLSEAQERWRDFCAKWEVPWVLLEAKRDELPPTTVARWVVELRPVFAGLVA